MKLHIQILPKIHKKLNTGYKVPYPPWLHIYQCQRLPCPPLISLTHLALVIMQPSVLWFIDLFYPTCTHTKCLCFDFEIHCFILLFGAKLDLVWHHFFHLVSKLWIWHHEMRNFGSDDSLKQTGWLVEWKW